MEVPRSSHKETSHPPTNCCHGYESVPEMFPDSASYLKVIGFGLVITVLQFALLVVIISKPWQ